MSLVNASVALFLPSLKGGGAEKCMLILAKGLANRGADVTLVVSKAEGPLLGEASTAIPIVDLGTRNIWKSIPRLAQYLRTAQPTVMISALDHANVAALAAKKLSCADTRVIVTTHTMVSVALAASPRPTSRGLPLLMRRLYPTASAVVAVSNAIACDLSETAGIPRDSVQVIYNPVAIREILMQAQERVGTRWFDPGSPPIVIAVGSLSAHKDHRTLIEAFNVARRHKPMRLVLLGEGPERSNLQNLVNRLGIEHLVLMPGYVANPYAWIARSAVFVLSSRWEGFGMVLVEAMTCGIPPVATDCPGGPAEVLENGRYGILTPVADREAMARAIVAMIESPLDSGRLKSRASEFSSEKAIDRYLRLISEVAG